jgi:AraC-like DNA-binding protein
MKPFPQKPSLLETNSFDVQSISTPAFHTGWHQHVENEIILFTQGSGVAIIGEYKEVFEAGDIFFLGSNLPHAFKNPTNSALSAVMILFPDNLLGTHFMSLPECCTIKQLLETATCGIRVSGVSKINLEGLIKDLTKSIGISKLMALLQCLAVISTSNDSIILTKNKIHLLNDRKNTSINKAMEFTKSAFHERISLSQISTVACMSIPSFCHYFKHHTGKTYIDFLNQVRIDYVCQQLQKTDKPVTEICYESGYNTIVHFHRQFLKIMNTTPLQYRKKQPKQINHEQGEL